jgi:hypothetical protein
MTSESRKKYNRAYLESHRESIRLTQKAWTKKRVQREPGYYMRYYWRNREAVLAKSKIKLALIKREVIDAYGGHCTCCGEENVEFLTLDHIYNDGSTHRKTVCSGSGFYIKLKNSGFPQGQLQVLCFNCNMAKGIYGQCPHVLMIRERLHLVAI